MAETNDRNAHLRSLRPTYNSITMLDGRRYGGRYSFDSNQVYSIPAKDWDDVYDSDGKKKEMIELIQWYVSDHFAHQLPRILELERYYDGDENIHYWRSGKGPKQADERITSGYPRYITTIHVGYELANPLAFGYSNPEDDGDTGEALLDRIKLFNQRNDEAYHDMVMFKNACNTGRAYELIYCPEGSSEPQMAPIDPNQAFVVWSADVKPVELFAVRYYAVNVRDETSYRIEVYTKDHIFYFKAGEDPASGWTLDDNAEHLLGSVPLIEYSINDERSGIFETQMDNIDAYDIAKSEMANSQEDFSNSKLVISGMIQHKKQPMTDGNGDFVFIDNTSGRFTHEAKDKNGKDNKQAVQSLVDTQANTMFLKPYMYHDANGNKMFSSTSAQYLTKEVNTTDWKTYTDEIKQQILMGTNTPDLSDSSFAQDQTGEALAYKLWGTDQAQASMHDIFKRGLMERVKLLAMQWAMAGKKDKDPKLVSPPDYQNVTISFTPNLPKNDDKKVELIGKLLGTGAISDETGQDMAADVTGVPASMEKQRMGDQKKRDGGDTGKMFKGSLADFQKGGDGDADSSSGESAD
ncbi:phage portal protein [Lactiplantibacillus daowaiensis]|uniref:Phage portal protein n=1 Tax=Lactiplantibacillus daowaiensis TaxID=2559918 RepID=A0ABW1RY04_9LACO|nr:phage portal protein [Lactiplantibacillus daowaiensis]